MTGVNYKIVPGFPRYRVGDDGSFWSYRWVKGSNGDYQWKRRSGRIHSHRGYVCVTLRQGTDLRERVVLLHVLVLELFVGLCPPGMEACHENDIKNDNRLKNLRWDTPKANWADRRKNGLPIHEGENHFRARANRNIVQQIRKLRKLGFTHQKIADRFKFSRTTVSAILARRTWKSV